jgi:hypothetical protein
LEGGRRAGEEEARPLKLVFLADIGGSLLAEKERVALPRERRRDKEEKREKGNGTKFDKLKTKARHNNK